MKKVKGLVPSLRERPFIATERLSRRGKRRLFALLRCQTSLLPKADKPHRNKQEGQNEAEKQSVVDHDVNDVVCANVK
jgi:hypothetical protein